jgi:putative Holliday junction resolvase
LAGAFVAKYLGIDYGMKRIGLATAESEVKLAIAFRTVGPNDLAKTISESGPFDAVVVGLPRSLDGHETPQTLAVRRFCDDVLWRKLHIDAVFQDEAGTSSVAEERLVASGHAYQKGDIDSEAAAVILQDYLDSI